MRMTCIATQARPASAQQSEHDILSEGHQIRINIIIDGLTVDMYLYNLCVCAYTGVQVIEIEDNDTPMDEDALRSQLAMVLEQLEECLAMNK